MEAQWTAQERGRERFRTEQPTYSILTRAIESDVLPTCARYGMGVLSYSPYSVARQRLANRFDLSLPENQRKLEAAGQLGELAEKAGITLIEMAIAFVLRHPGVTSAIIGPRTMKHLESQLTAASTVLSDDVLDQIEEIVPPGITLNPAGNGWVSPALQACARRR